MSPDTDLDDLEFIDWSVVTTVTDERGELLPDWSERLTPAHLRADVADFDLDDQLDEATP